MGRLGLVAALLVLAALPACSRFDPPDFAGEVIDFGRPDEVLVRLDEEHPDVGDDAYVWLGALSRETRAEVGVGDHVQVWITGGIDESNPPGDEATRLEVD